MGKKIISPLPIVFICTIFIIAVLNMNNFTTLYKTKIIEAKPSNKQTALSSIESEYADSFAGKTNYIDINGLFSRMVDKKELNERYKLNNGYLTYSLVMAKYNDSVESIANITNLKNYLELYDIPFAYVQTPHLIPTDDDEMIPAGYETHIHGNSDRLLEGLANNGISYLDLRENFKEDGYNTYDLYYPTDHHWTTKASFVAHKYIVEYINSNISSLNVNEYYFDIDNYTQSVMNCSILGSHGQRTGVWYSGVDKLTAILPNFETKFRVEMPSKSYDKTGTMIETMGNLEKYSNGDIVSSPEALYLFYNIGYRKITNFNTKNDTKIMLICDSFSMTLVPFLSLHFGEIHAYDVRVSYGGSPDEFIQTLHDVQPDIVLQIRDTNNALTDEAKKELS